MTIRHFLSCLALAAIAIGAPVTAQQSIPQLGIDRSGSCRNFSIYDPTKPGTDKMVPIACVDTTTHVVVQPAATITGGTITGITDLGIADGGTGASSASAARTNLGLGSIATQASSSVSITGGSVTGITDLAIADGGTGASTASAARLNLGVDVLFIERQQFTPVSAGTVNIAASTAQTVEVYFNHTSALTSLTVNFPAPVDGQHFLILWREAASSVTFTAPTGTLLGTFANTTANARSGWVYNAATGAWHRYS